MNIKWIIFAAAIWIIGTFIGATMEEHYLADHTVDVTGTEMTAREAMNELGSFRLIEWHTIGAISIPAPNISYFQTIIKMMTWDFAFMTGIWEYLRWFVFIPIAAGLSFGLFIMFVNAVMGALT